MGNFCEDATAALSLSIKNMKASRLIVLVFRGELWQVRARERTDGDGLDLVDLTARGG